MVLTAEPLHEAAACGDLDGVRALMAAAGDDPATRQQRRLDGATALHVAAAGGHAAIAAFLVGAGWRLGAVTDEGATPLHVAAACGHGPALAAMLTAAFAHVRAVVDRVTAGVASGTAAATATATAAATDAAKPDPLLGDDEELRRAVAAEDPDSRTWLRVALSAGHGDAAVAGALALPPSSESGAAAAVLAAPPVGVDAEWWLTDALGSGSASSVAVLSQLGGLLSDEQLLALASRPGPHGPTPQAAWVRLSLQNSSAAPALAALLPRLPRCVLQRLFDFDGCGLPPGLVSVQPHPAAQLVASVAATGAASAAWLAAELVILCLHTLSADSVDAALSSLLVLLPHLPAAELIAMRKPRCLACPPSASLLQLALLGHQLAPPEVQGPRDSGTDIRAARLLLRHVEQHWGQAEAAGGERVHSEAQPLPTACGAGVAEAAWAGAELAASRGHVTAASVPAPTELPCGMRPGAAAALRQHLDAPSPDEIGTLLSRLPYRPGSMAALVAEGYPVPVDLLVRQVQVMQRQLADHNFMLRNPWRSVGALDADNALLDGMAALPLAALVPAPAPGTVTDASVVPAVLGWRVCALSHQVLPVRAGLAQHVRRQVESAAGIAVYRSLCVNVASICPSDADFVAVWYAIEPIGATARRLMSEASATALLLELAPWDTGKTAWGNALAFYAAAHAYPGALAAALPAMTDAAVCMAAHTAIHGCPHAPCAQEGGVLMDLPNSAQTTATEAMRCTGDAQPVWGEVPHLVRPALLTLLRHPAAAAAAPAQLATCFHMRARHVLCSLGREFADLQRKALSIYLSPDICSAERVHSSRRNPPRIEAPTWRCLAAACLVEGAAYTRDYQGGDLDMALFVMDPVRRPPLLLPRYVEYEVNGHALAAAEPGAVGGSGRPVPTVTPTLPLLLGEWMAVKLAAGELKASFTTLMRARDYHCPASVRPRYGTTAGVPTAAARSAAANDDTCALGRHTAAVLHCCGPSAYSLARCGLAHRHPYLEPLALQLAAAADAVDERDAAFSASVGWPLFRPPHADSEVTRHSLDATVGRAALWRLLDNAGVDLGVVSGQPFRRRDYVHWPRLGWGGWSDWSSCSPSARLWHRALADCFEAGVGSLLLAASSVLMREIARCICRHAPAQLSDEQADERQWPPPPRPGLVGAAAADAFAAAAAAAAAYFDLATRDCAAPGPTPGLPRAERKAAVREARERAAALTPAEKAAARRARKEAGLPWMRRRLRLMRQRFPSKWRIDAYSRRHHLRPGCRLTHRPALLVGRARCSPGC
jgi:hypothetical protein